MTTNNKRFTPTKAVSPKKGPATKSKVGSGGKAGTQWATLPVTERIMMCLKKYYEGGVRSLSEKKLASECGYTNHNSPSYSKPFRTLKKDGMIETVNDGKTTKVQLTPDGVEKAAPTKPQNNEDCHRRIKEVLEGKGPAIFDTILDHQANGITREKLGEILNFTNLCSPSFAQPLRDLIKNGFVVEGENKVLRLTDSAFVENEEVVVNSAVV